jgi:hypothetical protein
MLSMICSATSRASWVAVQADPLGHLAGVDETLGSQEEPGQAGATKTAGAHRPTGDV